MNKFTISFTLIGIGAFGLGSFLGINNVPFTLTNFLWILVSCIMLIVGHIILYKENQ